MLWASAANKELKKQAECHTALTQKHNGHLRQVMSEISKHKGTIAQQDAHIKTIMKQYEDKGRVSGGDIARKVTCLDAEIKTL